MRILLISLLAIALSACAATTITNKSPSSAGNMRGASKSTLMREWGTPMVTHVAPNGNTQLVYTTQRYQYYPAPSSTGVKTVTTAGGLPIVIATPPAPAEKAPATVCTVTFEVDQHNMVVNAVVTGVGC